MVNVSDKMNERTRVCAPCKLLRGYVKRRHVRPDRRALRAHRHVRKLWEEVEELVAYAHKPVGVFGNEFLVRRLAHWRWRWRRHVVIEPHEWQLEGRRFDRERPVGIWVGGRIPRRRRAHLLGHREKTAGDHVVDRHGRCERRGRTNVFALVDGVFAGTRHDALTRLFHQAQQRRVALRKALAVRLVELLLHVADVVALEHQTVRVEVRRLCANRADLQAKGSNKSVQNDCERWRGGACGRAYPLVVAQHVELRCVTSVCARVALALVHQMLQGRVVCTRRIRRGRGEAFRPAQMRNLSLTKRKRADHFVHAVDGPIDGALSHLSNLFEDRVLQTGEGRAVGASHRRVGAVLAPRRLKSHLQIEKRAGVVSAAMAGRRGGGRGSTYRELTDASRQSVLRHGYGNNSTRVSARSVDMGCEFECGTHVSKAHGDESTHRQHVLPDCVDQIGHRCHDVAAAVAVTPAHGEGRQTQVGQQSAVGKGSLSVCAYNAHVGGAPAPCRDVRSR